MRIPERRHRMKNRYEEPVPSSPEPFERPSQEEIAARAFQHFEEHGAVHGHDLDDWLQAESELVEDRRPPRRR
jgi:hypothetical protein